MHFGASYVDIMLPGFHLFFGFHALFTLVSILARALSPANQSYTNLPIVIYCQFDRDQNWNFAMCP